MIFSAKWQNFCAKKYLCQCRYKYKISDCKPGSNPLFAASCWKVFVSSFCPLKDSMEPEALEYAGHGWRTDVTQILTNVFSMWPRLITSSAWRSRSAKKLKPRQERSFSITGLITFVRLLFPLLWAYRKATMLWCPIWCILQSGKESNWAYRGVAMLWLPNLMYIIEWKRR